MPSQGWGQVLVSSQADGTTLTAAAEASCIPAAAKYTLPANFLSNIGQQLLVRASGKISSVITTPGTARFKVKLGSVIAFDGLAILLDSVAAHTDVGWWLEILMTVRTIGASTSATLMGQGIFVCEDILGVPATAPKGCVTALLPWNATPAAGTGFDSTATQQCDLTFTQTAATGSCTCQQYSLTSLN